MKRGKMLKRVRPSAGREDGNVEEEGVSLEYFQKKVKNAFLLAKVLIK